MPQRDENNWFLVCLEVCNTYSLQEQTSHGFPRQLPVDCRPRGSGSGSTKTSLGCLPALRDLLAQGRALRGPSECQEPRPSAGVRSCHEAGRDGSDGHKQPRLQNCWHRTLPLSMDSHPPARAPRLVCLPTDSREPLPSPQIPFRESSGRRCQTLSDWISYSLIAF